MTGVDKAGKLVDLRFFKVDKLLISLCALVLGLLPLNGQSLIDDSYTSINLDVDTGLPYSNVDGLFQDDHGFMWISMFGGGLARYDGTSYVWINTNTEGAKVGSAVVTESCQDAFGRMWVSTAQGIDVIDAKTLTNVTMPENVRKTYEERYCNFVTSDSKGSIWYNIMNTIYRVSFDEDGGVAHLDSLACSDRYLDLRLDMVDVEGDGSVWTALDGEIYKILYVEGHHALEKVRLFPNLTLGEGTKASAFLKKDNVLWIGTNHGLFKLDLINGTHVVYRHSSSPMSLSHDEVTGLAMTDDGDVFISTLDGVNIYSLFEDGFVNLYSDVNKYGSRLLSGNLIRSIVSTGSQIWLGTELNGITVLKKKRLPVTNVMHRENDMKSLPLSPVSSIFFDSDGRLWTGSIEHGLFIHEGDFHFRNYSSSNSALAHNSVISMAADAHGKVWLGTMGGHIQVTDERNPGIFTKPVGSESEIARKIDNVNGLYYDSVNDCMWICSRTGLFRYLIKESRYEEFDEHLSLCFTAVADRYGRLWVGHRGGVTCINMKTGGHITYDAPEFGFFVTIDSYDNLWVGSFDRGLFRTSVAPNSDMSFRHYTSADGLADDRVRGVIADGDYLWVSTENGLSRVAVASGAIESFSSSDGLLSTTFYNNSVLKSPDGAIYLGQKSGLSILWSSYVKLGVENLAKIDFTRGIVGGKAVNLAYEEGLKFHERERSFAFAFADFSFESDPGVTYLCRIDPLDREWRVLDNNTKFVRYGSVPGGHHTIRIAARDASGNIVSEASRELRVVPYFWKTWWFAILLTMLVVAAIYLYVLKRTRAIEKNRAMLQQEVERQTKLLSEQKQQLQERADELAEQNKALLKQNEEMAGRTMVFQSTPLPPAVKKDSKFVEDLMAKIRDLYKDSELDINKMSEAMGMSRSVLNGKIQDAFGQSIGQFIRNYRLNVAREIICSGKRGEMNVSEIAYEVGFNDPKYFTRCFSKEFGMAPSAMMNGEYTQVVPVEHQQYDDDPEDMDPDRI